MKSKEKIFYYILKFLTKFEYRISIWWIIDIQYRISNIKYHSNFILVIISYFLFISFLIYWNNICCFPSFCYLTNKQTCQRWSQLFCTRFSDICTTILFSSHHFLVNVLIGFAFKSVKSSKTIWCNDIMNICTRVDVNNDIIKDLHSTVKHSIATK